MYYINMNTNSSSMGGLLNRAVDAHEGLERWREVRYLDVQLSVSGGLFQIKGHPEGLRDVIMRSWPGQLFYFNTPRRGLL
jgi:hypothetical protein